MALEKLTIKTFANYQDTRGDKKVIESFQVLFNPSEYTVEDSNKWQDQRRNRQIPELQYTGGERKKLTMELFFDTYEAKEDVRTYTSKLARLLVASIDVSNGKRPPIAKLSWGPKDPDPISKLFPFICVLETLSQKFTLFTSTGIPVRATLNVTFKEFSLPKDELKRKPRRRSFPARTYTVTAGETLSGIAEELWQDSRQWRRIAEVNDIDNPRLLTPGLVLAIPEIAD